MTAVPEPIVSLDALPLERHGHGDRFEVDIAEVGLPLGLDGLGCMLHVVAPGKIAFPYHRHHVSDEIFVILAGEGEYRIGDRRLPVRAGDCLGAPAGGEAHQIINTGPEPLRYLGLSNNSPVEIVEYPDSGKIGMRAGVKGNDPDYSTATLRKRGWLKDADYWEGE